MADGLDFICAVNWAVIGVDQTLQYQSQALSVVAGGALEIDGAALALVGKGDFIGAEALKQSFGQDRLIGHIEQLVFYGRATAIYYENLHGCRIAVAPAGKGGSANDSAVLYG